MEMRSLGGTPRAGRTREAGARSGRYSGRARRARRGADRRGAHRYISCDISFFFNTKLRARSSRAAPR